jgi:hypothetical protein
MLKRRKQKRRKSISAKKTVCLRPQGKQRERERERGRERERERVRGIKNFGRSEEYV